MSPYFSSLSEFFVMGGHGSYVWLCYGITFGCVLLMIWHAKNERKATVGKITKTSTRPSKLTNKQRKQLTV